MFNFKRKNKEVTPEYNTMFTDSCSRRTEASMKDAILCLLMYQPYLNFDDMRMTINKELEKNKLDLIGVDEFNSLLLILQNDGFIELNQ